MGMARHRMTVTATVLAALALAAPAEAFPLSIDNCGFPLEITRPPERVVAIKSTSRWFGKLRAVS